MTSQEFSRACFPLVFMCLVPWAQGATPDESVSSSRWALGPQGDIVWHLTDRAVLPHKDHMAMSGRSVDMILQWEIDANRKFSARRLIRWPMLRTLPDNTHASLQRRLAGPASPVVFVQGNPLTPGRVTDAAIHGTLKITTDHVEGLTQTRTLFTCVHSPAVIDLTLKNQS